MALVGLMVNEEEMVTMDKREILVDVVILVGVVQKENVLIHLGQLDLQEKWEMKE